MVDTNHILDLSERIAARFRPERIILFGSYATGNPAPDSDVDLLVILPFDGSPAYKALEILNSVDPHIPVDLLARTPEQVRQRLDANDWFMHDIIENGKTLYEAAHR